ncbi:MAG: hypothetical protein R2706_18330 [Acidimicrobiales bacterium]
MLLREEGTKRWTIPLPRGTPERAINPRAYAMVVAARVIVVEGALASKPERAAPAVGGR